MKKNITLFFCVVSPLLLFSQGAFNLINNRNHPELSWYIYETDHFRVIYSNGLAGMAKKTGSIAEQVYAVHQKNLGLSFKRKFPVFISDMDDMVVGATSPYGYLFFLVNPSDHSAVLTGPDGWLQKVISHEMVHALMFENTRGFLDFFLPLFVLQFRANLDICEGMAQFYAHELWGTERGDRYLNQGVRSGNLYPDPFDSDYGGLLYAEGFAKIKWLRQETSDRQLGKMFSLPNKWKFYHFKKSFQKTTGRSYSQFEKEWEKAVAVYYNWREAVSEPTETVGEKIIKIPFDFFQVIKAAPGGQLYAFTGIRSLQSPAPALYLWEKEKNRIRLLARKGIQPNFSIDQEGKRIVFCRKHYGRSASFIPDLYVVDIPTGRERQLTRNLRAREPVFVSADRIVFLRQEGAASNFYICRADGSRLEKLIDFRDEKYFSDLSVSPAGEKVIAAYLDPQRKEFGIAILDIDQKTVVEKSLPAQCRFPLLVPESGQEILYTSLEEDMPNVFRLNLQTGEKKPVTRQSNYLLITGWIAGDRAIGIRQTERQVNEAFALNPFRQPNASPGSLQEYYGKWRRTDPGVPMKIEEKEVPGRFRGKFHSLSTFRLLNLLPVPLWLGDRISFGFIGQGADMMGMNLLQSVTAFDFREPGKSDYSLQYTNRSTLFNIRSTLFHQHVITYKYRGQKNIQERIFSAAIDFSLPFSGSASYTDHLLHFGCHYEKSVPQGNEPGGTEAGDGLSSPLPYRIAGFSLGYRLTNVQPFKRFPFQGWGAALEYGFDHSVAGHTFSYHRFRWNSYRIQPLIGSVNLLLAADLQVIQGQAPPQNGPGMARYTTSDWIGNYSDQVYIRGGDRYYPGNRLLTATLEIHFPVIYHSFNMVAFLDGALVWQDSLKNISRGKKLFTTGCEWQIPDALLPGTVVGLGVARNLSENASGKWKFYFTIKQVLPF